MKLQAKVRYWPGWDPKNPSDMLAIRADQLAVKNEALDMAITMLDPENQPPQWTVGDALAMLREARNV